MRRAVLGLAMMALAMVLAGGVAQAIINGEPDSGPKAHPYVGAYVAKVEGKLRPVCSGTLISPRVFLTAGHCTQFEIERDRSAYVSFDPTYKPGASRCSWESNNAPSTVSILAILQTSYATTASVRSPEPPPYRAGTLLSRFSLAV
jgi:hypothetical protein